MPELEQHMKAEDVIIFKDMLLRANRGIIYDRIEDEGLADSLLEEISREFGRITGEGNTRRLNPAPQEG